MSISYWKCSTLTHLLFTSGIIQSDHLFGIVVSTSDCHPRGPGFDSRLYPRNFSRSLERGPSSLVRPIGYLLDMRSSEIRLKTEIKVEE